MERDLQVHTEDIDRLRAELTYIVEFFHGLGYERCDVLFGFAWRTDADKPDLSWRTVRIPLLDLDAEVRRAENAGLGNFAGDDVWLSFEDRALKVQFCHHSGIHFSYSEPDEVVEHFFVRWRDEGLEPIEWEKTEDPLKWLRVRGGSA